MQKLGVWGAALAAFVSVGCAGGAAAQAPAREMAINGVEFLRAAVPPAVMQQILDAKRAGAVSSPVMEKSDAAQVRAFRDYVDRTVARERDRSRQLQMVNVYVNHHVKQVPDSDLYANVDLWAPPLNTLLVGGDCEDFVLLKRWALLRLGFKAKDIYLLGGVSRALGKPGFHAVLLVLTSPHSGVILDSLSDTLFPSGAAARFRTTYALNTDGFWMVESPSAEDRPYVEELLKTGNPTVVGR